MSCNSSTSFPYHNIPPSLLLSSRCIFPIPKLIGYPPTKKSEEIRQFVPQTELAVSRSASVPIGRGRQRLDQPRPLQDERSEGNHCRGRLLLLLRRGREGGRGRRFGCFECSRLCAKWDDSAGPAKVGRARDVTWREDGRFGGGGFWVCFGGRAVMNGGGTVELAGWGSVLLRFPD